MSRSDLYHRFCLRCRVDAETDKAYYWPTMAKIYDLILPITTGWQDCKLRTDQALQRYIGKPAQDGSQRSTLRAAALGGLRKLNRDNLHHVSTKYLNHNAHLIARFDDRTASLAPFLTADQPEAVYFFLTEMFADRARVSKLKSQTIDAVPHDFYLRIGGYQHQYNATHADPINQALELYVRNGVLPPGQLMDFVRQLGTLTGALHVWHAQSGFCGESFEDEQGYHRVRFHVMDAVEDAVDQRNRFGSAWIDLLARV